MPNNSIDNNTPWLCPTATKIVLAWGGYGKHQGRSAEVLRQLTPFYKDKMYVLGYTKNGEPCHPLKVKHNAELIKYDSRRIIK